MGDILAWQHITGHVGANEFLRRVGAAAGARTKGVRVCYVNKVLLGLKEMV